MVEGNMDYIKLINAINFYSKQDFNYIDVPWLVNEEVSNITKPPYSKNFYVKDKVLVASAEQSFAQLILDKKLQKGKYVTVTPCFRDEVVDDLHKQYFMKVELINTQEPTESKLKEMVEIAQRFFNLYLSTTTFITDFGIDLISQEGVELGSYGVRDYKGHSWIYGTGCAEPRLSQAIMLSK